MSVPLFSKTRMQYETPREGVTIGGYVARRLHKTILLKCVPELLEDASARVLAQIALYTAAASTSFGPAPYQPDRDAVGTVIETRDPETNARVTVTCEERLRFTYRVEMEDVGVLSGAETITGTTVDLRGLGMPAPTKFTFTSEQGNYRADIIGIITSELAPGFGSWKIRGFGALDLSDNAGNHGRLSLDRSGIVLISITTRDGRILELKQKLV